MCYWQLCVTSPLVQSSRSLPLPKFTGWLLAHNVAVVKIRMCWQIIGLSKTWLWIRRDPEALLHVRLLSSLKSLALWQQCCLYARHGVWREGSALGRVSGSYLENELVSTLRGQYWISQEVLEAVVLGRRVFSRKESASSFFTKCSGKLARHYWAPRWHFPHPVTWNILV